ncbi:MAG: radical SAM family heme chaperone HemW [Simkaniaceae bacterium]|nr:radical SAM family heme chaperone HemW [Simkaniaceae bacterium]
MTPDFGKNPSLESVSVYFHIPFCSKKCPYCHFFVLPDKKSLKDQLLVGFKKEWQAKLSSLKNKNIVSIYFGGGTPTLFVNPGIKNLLQWTNDLHLDPNIEITVEANPETVTLALMKELKSYGVNRISIGVQSLDNDQLLILGREHSANKAIDAVNITKKAGIDNITLDLMYDLPHQTLQNFSKTLDQIENLPITHLSLYNLTIEPQTAFYKKRETLINHLPSDENSLKLLELACKRLETMGLKRYEISAFARDGAISIHNTGYWKARPFHGFGPSAFSYIEGRRFRNIAHSKKYLEQEVPIDFEEKLEDDEHKNELLAIHLRLLDGVDLPSFQKTHGPLPKQTLINLQILHAEKYLELSQTKVKLSNKGLLFYDTVATKII